MKFSGGGMQAAPSTPSLAPLASMSSNDSEIDSESEKSSSSSPAGPGCVCELAGGSISMTWSWCSSSQPTMLSGLGVMSPMPPSAFRANSAALLLKPMSISAWTVAHGGGDTARVMARTLLVRREVLRSLEVTEPGAGAGWGRLGAATASSAAGTLATTGEPRLALLAAAAEARYWHRASAAASSSSVWYMAFTGLGWVAFSSSF